VLYLECSQVPVVDAQQVVLQPLKLQHPAELSLGVHLNQAAHTQRLTRLHEVREVLKHTTTGGDGGVQSVFGGRGWGFRRGHSTNTGG